MVAAIKNDDDESVDVSSCREHSFVIWNSLIARIRPLFRDEKSWWRSTRHIIMAVSGLAYIGHSGDAKDDLIVSIAGPLTHIPQALLWYGLSQAFSPGTFMYMLCVHALRLNISLMLFNLFIPCYPLDGGRIFAASLQLMKIRVDIAAKICAFVSLVCAVSIGVYGFLHDEIIAMFIGFWCAQESYNLYVHTKEERLQEHQIFSKYAIETNDGPYNQI